jgi:integrase/recombinase XerD
MLDMSEMRLFTPEGQRLYCTPQERENFLREAQKASPQVRTFCETLAYTGCRISEALELVPRQIDLDGHTVTFRSLKKRRDDVYRLVPVPEAYLDALNIAFNLRQTIKHKRKAEQRLWSWSRPHAYVIVRDVMIKAGIADGPHRTAKGLRHAFGVNAVTKSIPLNMLCKWMGHADIKTTAIYANAIGQEERSIAQAMWT